ncbi:hypothetical protein Pfo_013320 [Paulownia fortunei]|nr:hypothetical protein Pfo_013320 [Paulownia fortunei]
MFLGGKLFCTDEMLLALVFVYPTPWNKGILVISTLHSNRGKGGPCSRLDSNSTVKSSYIYKDSTFLSVFQILLSESLSPKNMENIKRLEES